MLPDAATWMFEMEYSGLAVALTNLNLEHRVVPECALTQKSMVSNARTGNIPGQGLANDLESCSVAFPDITVRGGPSTEPLPRPPSPMSVVSQGFFDPNSGGDFSLMNIAENSFCLALDFDNRELDFLTDDFDMGDTLIDQRVTLTATAAVASDSVPLLQRMSDFAARVALQNSSLSLDFKIG
ncbi:hypothetical protein ANO11243_067360 [Dothideomycetidae sp. 11243]|nr:hypothetical protein ANO11243_067360 [fungal sp. No.11243]